LRIRKLTPYILGLAIALPVFSLVWGGSTARLLFPFPLEPAPLPSDTPVNLHYPFKDRLTDTYSNEYDESPLYGSDPSNIKSTVEYDPDNQEYIINEKMGSLFYRNPSYMTFQEYIDEEFNKTTKQYWKQRSGEDALVDRKPLIPKLYVGGQFFDRIFGGNTVDIRPQGSAELTFGANIQRNDNPAIPEKQRKNTNFDFKEKIQLNVIGNIGTKLKLGFNYNTEASFDFENKMKLEYTGTEDEIIQKIEAGNVTLPLTGTLITGSQSLFGIKTAFKFGHLTVTSIFSQEKGKASTIDVAPGGAQTNTFDILADQYEVNKHYFLAQYFKDSYDDALKNLPIVNSNITISKVEVWVTNTNYSYENTRNIIAFLDLAEYNFANKSGFIQSIPVIFPDNATNTLYAQLDSPPLDAIRDSNASNQVFQDLNTNYQIAPGRDYERIEGARRLNSTEYSLNATLGYISLNTTLNPDQVLAVAFEYTYQGKAYRVGDLTTSGIEPPKRLYLKLLKSQNVTTKLNMPNAGIVDNPLWDLMMKNVYSLNSYQIQKDKFKLDVLYTDDRTGNAINFLPVAPSETFLSGKSLIKVFNLDKANTNNDPQPDGVFDFVEGITINSANGRIIFPVREPFGSFLRSKFKDQAQANFYVFDALYDSTKTAAQQQPEKNKFSLRGSYQSSSSSEISLNAINIPQGSVKVTAGGTVLVENQDYTVDYNLGRVKIINAGLLNSGTPLQISLESNSLFNIQTKTLWGTHLDYDVSKDFVLGGTFLHLGERPITQKVNIGDEPISNTMWGVDGTWKSESRLLTRLVDKLPLISTKDPSQVTISGEFAQLIPGNAKAIGTSGTSYIDDFEGSESEIDLRNPGSWFLASTPQLQETFLFPEAIPANFGKLEFGKNRAKLAWYSIDPSVFYRDNNITPPNLSDDELSDNNVREWFEKDLFPNKQAPNNIETTISVLNLAFYPTERGPYNYDVNPVSGQTSGISADGRLLNPKSRWGGIMRRLETSDFEAANVEYIQLWMMDPFNDDNWNPNNTGDLYFNLGNVSEDVLNDGYKSFENGLPTATVNSPTVNTNWGVIATSQTIVNAFDNDPNSRTMQDVGLDGLNDANEQTFFQDTFLNKIASSFGVGSPAFFNASADPSSDDFNYYRDESKFDNPEVGILMRYKKYNGVEGNSPTSTGTYTAASTTVPDNEDINRDNGISTNESYYQYHVKIDKNSMVVGKNYITDEVVTTTKVRNGTTKTVKWYQFKIPVRDAQAQNIGDIQDFKSIRFIRMFMKNFNDSMVLRFARLELLRGEWRKCPYDLRLPFETLGSDPSVQFDIGTVNLEENGDKVPVPYVLPPGIEREINQGSTTLQELNEQSLTLKVCNLEDGDARAAYKTLSFDFRQYNKVKMYVHAETQQNAQPLKKGDLSVFIRIGTDFNNNFYEYEIEVTPTDINSGTKDPYQIWPTANNFDIDLDELVRAKVQRDNSGAPYNSLYKATSTGMPYAIYVVGNPTLSNVRTILIGVRNVKKDNNHPLDDGLPKCAEIWVNELRLNDFDNRGGWAANARISTRLASLGTVNISGAKSTYGWGSIEKKLNERSKEDITQYDVSSNMEIGKFFPDKSGISIPMYIDYAEIISKPQYDPLNPDVPFIDAVNAAESKEEKKVIKQRAEDYIRRKSINFTNVKKNKTKASSKSHLYDIENVNMTWAYSEIYKRNINTEYDVLRNYHAGLGYNFNTQPKNVAPLSKASWLGNSKYLKLIKDFNFYFMPSSLNFRSDIDRIYGESLQRNNTDYIAILDTNFNKSYTWNRIYDLKFDFTKSLKFDFNASNLSRIDEPAGKIDTKAEKDSVRKNLMKLGRNLNYHHGGNLTYTIPLNKIPLTDWISASARWGFDYTWMAGPLELDSATNRVRPSGLGNTIQNSNTRQLNSTFTLTSLYNKVPFFKKALGPKPLPQKKPIVKAPIPTDSSKVAKDSLGVKGKKLKKPKVPGQMNPIVRATVRAILGVKNASFTYSETYGTMVPGYTPYSEFLGSDWGKSAPGAPFIFGYQDDDFPFRAARNGWLTTDTIMNSQYTKTFLNNFSGRMSIEPFDGFRVELNANRNYSNNVSENFRSDDDGTYHAYNHLEAGNFSISYLTLSTAFITDNKDYSSDVFKKFADNRIILSKRLAAEDPNSSGLIDTNGFVDGYGPTSQEVLTGAFLAAYSGGSASSIKLTAFPKIPMPNWRVTYDGLSKIPLIKKLFQNVSLSHAYRSTYSVNSYSTNLFYKSDGTARDQADNFIAKYEIGMISISEQFSPLIGVDITWKNNLTTRFEYKKDRNLSLTYTGIQLTEVKGTELVLGLGYRVPKFNLPFKINGKVARLNNDLNLTADFGIRKDNTIVRKMQEQTNQPTAGLKITTIKFATDYAVNERLNIRAFYDMTINKPVVSTSFPTANTQIGITIRFTLAQ